MRACDSDTGVDFLIGFLRKRLGCTVVVDSHMVVVQRTHIILRITTFRWCHWQTLFLQSLIPFSGTCICTN